MLQVLGTLYRECIQKVSNHEALQIAIFTGPYNLKLLLL